MIQKEEKKWRTQKISPNQNRWFFSPFLWRPLVADTNRSSTKQARESNSDKQDLEMETLLVDAPACASPGTKTNKLFTPPVGHSFSHSCLFCWCFFLFSYLFLMNKKLLKKLHICSQHIHIYWQILAQLLQSIRKRCLEIKVWYLVYCCLFHVESGQ